MKLLGSVFTLPPCLRSDLCLAPFIINVVKPCPSMYSRIFNNNEYHILGQGTTTSSMNGTKKKVAS